MAFDNTHTPLQQVKRSEVARNVSRRENVKQLCRTGFRRRRSRSLQPRCVLLRCRSEAEERLGEERGAREERGV